MRYRFLSLPILVFAALGGGCSPHDRGSMSHELEPIEGIEVVSANLKMDLRPLAEKQPARVQVEYNLHNPGEPQEVEFILVQPPARTKENVVLLNQQPIPELPAGPLEKVLGPKGITEVVTPNRTPPMADDKADLPYECIRDAERTPIRVKLPAGPSQLSISYLCPVTATVTGVTTLKWQYVHHFKPAAKWRRCGPITVLIELPPGWETANNLQMRRDGDRLEKAFPKVPDEPLLLTTRFVPDEDQRRLLHGVTIGAGIIGIVATFLFGRSAGRQQADYERRVTHIKPYSGHLVLVVFGWIALALAMAWWDTTGMYKLLVPETQRPRDFESSTNMALCCSGPPAAGVLTAVGLLVFWLGRSLAFSSRMSLPRDDDFERDDDRDWRR